MVIFKQATNRNIVSQTEGNDARGHSGSIQRALEMVYISK